MSKNIFDYNCDWTCDKCGTLLNDQEGFTCITGKWVCTECGFENDVSPDNIIFNDDFDSDDDIPEGCLACGGDYPHCKDSCKMFDD